MVKQPRRFLLCAIAIALLLGQTRTARADIEGECKSQQCPAGSPHEYEVISCDTPACYCWNSCGSSSSSNTSSNGGLVGAMAVALAYGIYYTVGIFTIPAIMIEMKMPPAEIAKRRARAAEAWKHHRSKIRNLEERGRELPRMEARLAAFEKLMAAREGRPRQAATGFDWGADDLRDAPSGTAKPSPRPRLVPSRDFQCNQARIVGPFHRGGPIAGFADEAAMRAACADLFPPPTGAHPVQQPGDVDCHVQRDDGTPLFCPAEKPYLNPCSAECFSDTDFRDSSTDDGRHCWRSIDCKVSGP